MRLVPLCLLAALLAGCDLFQDGPTPADPGPRGEARYRVTFEATWSAETHPDAFPPNPHFSRLTGAAHSPAVTLWRTGLIASEGVRAMAETGATAPLRAEMDAYEFEAAFFEGEPVRASPGTATAEVVADERRYLVSVVAMLAPSPDWFVGTSALDLRDGEAGWVDEVSFDLRVYDAGTDDGAGYTAADAPRPVWTPVGFADYAPIGSTSVGRMTLTRAE